MGEDLRPPAVRIRDPRYRIEAGREERALAEQKRPREREPGVRGGGARVSADVDRAAGRHRVHA